MMGILRKIWATFTWTAFSIGVFSLLLMLWAKAWPYVNARYFEPPTKVEQPEGLALVEPPSRIHPDFLQNLNNQLSTGETTDRISALAFSSQDEVLVVGRESGKVDIWDAKQANARREIKAHKQRTSKLMFSSDGQVFFSNSYFENITQVWDTASGTLLHTIQGPGGPVVETSDSQFFVIAGSSELRLFDLKNKTLLPEKYSVSSGVVTAITYNLLTEHLAIGTASGGIEIWKFNNKQEVWKPDSAQTGPSLERIATAKPYETGNWVKSVRFFNYGRSLYSIPERGPIDEWSVYPLEPLRSREHGLKYSSSPLFIPEKNLLALVGFADTNSHAGFLELINLETGKMTMTDLQENGSGIITYLPSLSTLISATGQTISVINLKAN